MKYAILYLIYNAAIAGCFCLCVVFGTPLMILTVPIPAIIGIWWVWNNE